MTFPRSPSRIAQYDRDARIARALAKRLRTVGLAPIWFDKRDASGMRLWAANLRCGHVWILCRSAHYVDDGGQFRDTDFQREHPGSVIWRPCDDFATLVRYLWLSTGGNPFDMPKC